MSASMRSSSSRSCPYWRCRSYLRAIPSSHASGIFQDHPRPGKEGEAASRMLVELQVVLPQDMVSPPYWSETTLGCGSSSGGCQRPERAFYHAYLRRSCDRKRASMHQVAMRLVALSHLAAILLESIVDHPLRGIVYRVSSSCWQSCRALREVRGQASRHHHWPRNEGRTAAAVRPAYGCERR